jgi:hypothetical protein
MATVQIPRIEDLDLTFMHHPRTGKLVMPVFTNKAGRHVWPIMGGAPDEDLPDPDDDGSGDDDADDDNSDADDDADDDDADDDSTDKSKKKSKKDDDEDKPVEKWRYDKVQRRMQAADRRANTAEAKIKELETQLAGKVDPKDVDKTTAEENAKLKPQVTKLTEDNQRLTLQVAFLTTNDIKWHDPEAALRLADLSEVDIDEETGKVDRRALKAALRALAKEKKYLVDDGKEEDADDDDDDKSSGPTMNRKRKGSRTDKPTRAVLSKRFPALNQ